MSKKGKYMFIEEDESIIDYIDEWIWFLEKEYRGL